MLSPQFIQAFPFSSESRGDTIVDQRIESEINVENKEPLKTQENIQRDSSNSLQTKENLNKVFENLLADSGNLEDIKKNEMSNSLHQVEEEQEDHEDEEDEEEDEDEDDAEYDDNNSNKEEGGISEQKQLKFNLGSFQQNYHITSKGDNGNQGRWTKEEHSRFVEGLSLFGKNWKKVEEYVGSRTGAQIRSHAQKFFNKLERNFNKKSNLHHHHHNHNANFSNQHQNRIALLNSGMLTEKSLIMKDHNLHQIIQANYNHHNNSIKYIQSPNYLNTHLRQLQDITNNANNNNNAKYSSCINNQSIQLSNPKANNFNKCQQANENIFYPKVTSIASSTYPYHYLNRQSFNSQLPIHNDSKQITFRDRSDSGTSSITTASNSLNEQIQSRPELVQSLNSLVNEKKCFTDSQRLFQSTTNTLNSHSSLQQVPITNSNKENTNSYQTLQETPSSKNENIEKPLILKSSLKKECESYFSTIIKNYGEEPFMKPRLYIYGNSCSHSSTILPKKTSFQVFRQQNSFKHKEKENTQLNDTINKKICIEKPNNIDEQTSKELIYNNSQQQQQQQQLKVEIIKSQASHPSFLLESSVMKEQQKIVFEALSKLQNLLLSSPQSGGLGHMLLNNLQNNLAISNNTINNNYFTIKQENVTTLSSTISEQQNNQIFNYSQKCQDNILSQ